MKLIPCLYLLMLLSVGVYAQDKAHMLRTDTVKIESGITLKHWQGNELQSITVAMFAVNYGNQLTFIREKDTIQVTNVEEPGALVSIYFKKGRLVKELRYKGQLLYHNEVIAYDRNALPPASRIACIQKEGKLCCTATKRTELQDNLFHELKISFKLLLNLEIPDSLTNTSAVYAYIAGFFSREEALALIYKSGVNGPGEPVLVAYLDTDDAGAILNGIHWVSSKDGKSYSEVYKDKKVTQKKMENLQDFQQTFKKYWNEE